MKASELRIGNYVTTINRSNKIHLPTGITEMIGTVGLFSVDLYDYKKHFSEQQPRKESLANITPIPLTEELLIKFGFFRKYDIYALSEFNIAHLTNGLNERSFVLLDVEDNVVSIDFNYVHQLQNLYFCLTGEELTIKTID